MLPNNSEWASNLPPYLGVVFRSALQGQCEGSAKVQSLDKLRLGLEYCPPVGGLLYK